jgi:autotransporter-associated beta strand protein
MKPVITFRKLMAIGIFMLACTATTTFAQYNYIVLTNSDALGTSSFVSGTSATNWSNGLPPFSGNGVYTNGYFTTNHVLRTPTGSGNYSFLGDFLSVDPGGFFGTKGNGLITVTNLLFNGGTVQNSGTGASPDMGLLAGSINIEVTTSVGGSGNATGTGTNTLNIMAPMSGVGGLSIINSGTVIFSATNTYQGATEIKTNAILKMGCNSGLPTGATAGSVTVNFGGTLDINGYNMTINALDTGAAGSNQPVVINGAVNTTNTLTIGNADAAFAGSFSGILEDNKGTGGVLALTKIGAGTFVPGTNMTYSGDTTINGGIFKMGRSLITPNGAGKGNFIIGENGTLDMAGRSENINGLSGSGTIINSGGFVGTDYTLTLGNNNISSNFSGTIEDTPALAGNVAITKTGTGTQTFSGPNTYSGPTIINNGTLLVSGSLGPSSSVFVNNGTLAGGGTIAGTVYVTNSSTAIIHPEGGSMLTVESNLTVNASSEVVFDLTNSISSGDDQIVLNGQGVLTCNEAQITINSAGTLAPANYVLLNVTGGGSISGTFSNTPAWMGVTPANSSSYAITNIGNQVLLEYNSSSIPRPYITSLSLSGSNIIINGTNGTPEQQYILLTSTNVDLPLNQWTPVATNTFSGGSFSLTNTVNASARQNFYLIDVH